MWVDSKECEEIIIETWRNEATGCGMENLCLTLKKCGKIFDKWNRSSFGNVHQDLRRRRMETPDESTMKEIKRVRQDINDWLEREEIMWRQRSKVLWLNEGDQNSKYFHSKAT